MAECKTLCIVGTWQKKDSTPPTGDGSKGIKKPQRDVARMSAKDVDNGFMQISLIRNDSEQQTISIPWSAFQELILEFDRVEDAGEVKEIDVEEILPKPKPKVKAKSKRKRKRPAKKG